MKNILLLILFTFFCFSANAQKYDNEWIDFSKAYYKIKIGQDNIYRIPTNVIQEAGLPLNPNGYKIYHKGEEVPIHTSSNSTFQNADFIEFYGKRNDGTYDTQLFREPDWQVSERVSAFNDTAAYFLVWDDTEPGKRITEIGNDISVVPDKEEFFEHSITEVLAQEFFEGKPDSRIWAGVNSYLSDFGRGEGFTSTIILPGVSRNFSFPTPSPYFNGGTAKVKTKLIGRSNDLFVTSGDHHVEIKVNDNLYVDGYYEGYEFENFEFEMPVTEMSNLTTFNFTSKADTINEEAYHEQLAKGLNIYPNYPMSNDRNSVAFIEVTYPHSYDFNNRTSYHFSMANENVKYMEIENFNGENDPILYDLDANLRLLPIKDGDVYKIRINQIPSQPEKRNLYIANQNTGIKLINELEQTNFIDYSNPSFAADYIMITHPLLRGDINGVNQIQRYEEYRASNAGGNYTPLSVNIDQIYDQFGFGIYQHPQAIRNFCNFIIDQHSNGSWSIQPDYLFLIGKSIRYSQTKTNPANYRNNLVPTYGTAGSDILLSSRSIYTYKNQLATGRVSAKSTLDLKAYLDKVIQYESLQNEAINCETNNKDWMKNVLHIAAGANGNEEVEFISYLNGYEEIVEDEQYGGDVLATLSSASVNVEQYSISEYLAQGLSLITFFGHSNGEFWKYDIGTPENYDYDGRFPFIFSSSCFVGDIHKTYSPINTIMAEKHTLAQEAGTVGFLASVSFGFPSLLDKYSISLYNNFSNTLYGEPISKCIQKTILDVYDPDEIGIRITCQEFTLSGDPAITLYHFDQPDFEISPASIAFEPETISSSNDSVKVIVTVSNHGKAIADSIDIKIEQTLPDGLVGNTVVETVASPSFEESYSIYIPIKTILNENPIGEHSFKVTVNEQNTVSESCFDNNSTIRTELVLPTAALPLEPCKYAIVSNNQITLKATSSTSILEETKYTFQIDSTNRFDSILASDDVTSKGGIIQWKPNPSIFTFENNKVYYWRISVNPKTPEEPFTWESSSFTYIDGSPDGWDQSHIYQFEEDAFTESYINFDDNLFEYTNVENALYCRNTFTNTAAEVNLLEYQINNITQVSNSCLLQDGASCRNGISFVVLSPSSFEPLRSYLEFNGGTTCEMFGQYNDIHCTATSKPIFQFTTESPEDINDIMSLVDDIPDGYYVLAYSANEHNLTSNVDPDFQSVLPPLHEFFENMGFPGFGNKPKNSTFIAFGRKNKPNFDNKHFLSTQNETEVLELDILVNSNKNAGNILSTNIGPSKKWDKLIWDSEPVFDFELNDSIEMNIYGVGSDGSLELLKTSLEKNIDLTDIDANKYPTLRIEARTNDYVDFTMPQLQYWRVLYDRYPEISLNQNLGYKFESDTLFQGTDGYFEMAVTNVTNIDMDSLLVHYIMIDAQKTEDTIAVRYPPVPANSTNTIKFDFPTGKLIGDVFMKVILNALGDQPEKLDFNNRLLLPFHVIGDQINPILDVTFDGAHISNGDIVSANPEIRIKITDENLFNALDENSVSLVLTNNTSGQSETIDLTNDNVVFNLPSAEEMANGQNCIEMIYTPTFLEDGTYSLEVNGKDKSNNIAGTNEYIVSFQIVLKSSITQVVNYPNPFTTATRFVFTLTGSEVPENLKIQVFTISGRVVREISKAELGNVRIGKNISDFVWDGTDQYGNELANGVYFYKVTATNDNQDVENLQITDLEANQGKYNMSSTKNLDAVFGKHNIGKLYKLR